MNLVELTAEDELALLHRDVLVPAFPPDELVPADALHAGVVAGVLHVSAALDENGAPVAGAVVEWSPSCRVLLLAYLAVVGDGRGGGTGGALHRHVLSRWTAEYAPCLYVAEVEHPDGHPTHAAHGDPLRRLRFYGSHGARVLRLPYFQPALHPEARRVPAMLLLALHVDPAFTGPRPDSVAGAPLGVWMTDYLEETEGGIDRVDPATTALLDALEAPEGVDLLDVERYGGVPISEP